ncbi:MAG: phosphodiester glycosidase family protein [Ferruginibacter sp.]
MMNNKSYKILSTAGLLLAVCFFINSSAFAQVKWVNVDTAFGPLPSSVQVFKTTDSLDGKPFIAYYVKAKLKDRQLVFTTDTTLGRRLTPVEFYQKNEKPLIVVNCTFFNFDKNQNLNVVIKKGKLLGYNVHTIPMKGKDTFQYRHPLGSALGIDKKRNADVAWLYTDSSISFPYARQWPIEAYKDSMTTFPFTKISNKVIAIHNDVLSRHGKIEEKLEKWKMKTAIGGGPVLVQEGHVRITNNEELKFTGKAINDKHPRTCMGYTSDGYLVIMAIQGRFPGIAEGATLEQEAKLLLDLGCTEALNLDGGGSSCLLINGKETIKPSDKTGERPVPAVFIISKK